MSVSRFLQRAVLIVYLVITAAAFVYTMTRVRLLPWPLMRFSYGMMAPYQTYATVNADLVAEGKAGGTWRPIDLSRYYPEEPGEAALRKYLLLWRWPAIETGDDRELNHRYALLAQQILLRERQRGSPVTAVRLSWAEWPVSPAGREALRQWPFLKLTPLAQVP